MEIWLKKHLFTEHLPVAASADTVLEGDNRSYFSCGHGEQLLIPVIQTYIHLRAFSTYLTLFNY